MILERLKNAMRIEKGSGSHIDVANRTITVAREEDLQHELLHLALRHWQVCGRGVNLAADLALRPFLETDENLVSNLPADSTLEEHMREMDDLPAEFGDSNRHVSELLWRTAREDEGLISDHLDDMGSAPMEVQLALSACFTCICDELNVAEAFAALPREMQSAALRGPLPAGVLNGVMKKLPEESLEIARRSLAYRRVEYPWAAPPDHFGIDHPFVADGRLTGVGSGMDMDLERRHLHSGVLSGSTLTDCTGWVGELIQCDVRGSHLHCCRTTNCVFRNAQIDSDESTCNLHMEE